MGFQIKMLSYEHTCEQITNNPYVRVSWASWLTKKLLDDTSEYLTSPWTSFSKAGEKNVQVETF